VSDPTAPAPAAEAAPVANVEAAAPVAAAPAVEAPKRVFKNPYAKPAAPAAASPAPAAEAKPAPATPTRSRALALAQSKLASVTTELAPLRERATKYEAALAPLAKQALEGLPEYIDRAALAKKHGADALGLLEEVNYLRSIGALAAPAAKPVATTTTAAAPSTVAAAAESDADLIAYRQHEKLSKQSRSQAQLFFTEHRAAIERGMAKATAH